MVKLYSSDHIIKVLKKNDFHFLSHKGSHSKFHKVRAGENMLVIIPTDRAELPMGTFYSILRQSDLSHSDFK